MKLTLRLMIQILASLAVVVLPLSAFQLYSLFESSYEDSYHDNFHVIQSFSAPVSEAIWSLDKAYMKHLTTSLVLSGTISRVEIYDEDLNLFAAANKLSNQSQITDPEPGLLPPAELSRLRSGQNSLYREKPRKALGRLAIPILSIQGSEAMPSFRGVLAIEYSLKSVNQKMLYQILQNALMITIFTLVVSLILFYSLKRSVITPLFELLKAMRLMPNDRSVRLDPTATHTTEIAKIYQTFNNMVEDLQKKENVITEQRKQMVQSSKMSALGEMAAGIAHEINNPLAIIVGYNHIVRELVKRDQPDKPEIFRNLSKIQETTDRISKIIQGLRTFSRNTTSDPREWNSLKVIIENALEFCAQRLKNHGIDLILDPVPAVELFCRDSQMIQVLLNLLNNAFDAVQEHVDDSWIRISFAVNKDGLTIQVTDSGPGIPAMVAEKVMQPFFTTKEVGKGTGLGLSISKGIIEEHGGQLLFNRQNPHTQFVIEMPTHIFRDLQKNDEKGLNPQVESRLAKLT